MGKRGKERGRDDGMRGKGIRRKEKKECEGKKRGENEGK